MQFVSLMPSIPRTRTGDPRTSHEAEAFMRKSGRMKEQQRIVLEMVRKFPGQTAREYQGYPGFDDPCAPEGIFRRRLVELERDGLVRRGEVREQRYVSGGSKRRAATWYPA